MFLAFVRMNAVLLPKEFKVFWIPKTNILHLKKVRIMIGTQIIILKCCSPARVSNLPRRSPKKDFSEVSNRTTRQKIAEVAIRDESGASPLRVSDFQGNKSISEKQIK